QGQRMQCAVMHQADERELPSVDVTLDQRRVVLAVVCVRRRSELLAQSFERAHKRRRVVGATDAASARRTERLDHARERDHRCERHRIGARRGRKKPRHEQIAIAQTLACQQLIARDAGRCNRVPGERERGGDGGGNSGRARIRRKTAGDDAGPREANDLGNAVVVETAGGQFVNEQIDAEAHGRVLIALSLSACRLQEEHAAHRLCPGRGSILSQRSRDGVSSLAMSDVGSPAARASHPPGLYVLFFTEMWERYSFYSMMAILILYMNESLHFSVAHAGRVYGMYQAGVYLMPVAGGLLADRWLGFIKAIIVGGVLMMFGHLVLGVEALPFFYAGLVL